MFEKCDLCGSERLPGTNNWVAGPVFSLVRLEFGKPQIVHLCNREACAKAARAEGYEYRHDLTYSRNNKAKAV